MLERKNNGGNNLLKSNAIDFLYYSSYKNYNESYKNVAYHIHYEIIYVTILHIIIAKIKT